MVQLGPEQLAGRVVYMHGAEIGTGLGGLLVKSTLSSDQRELNRAGWALENLDWQTALAPQLSSGSLPFARPHCIVPDTPVPVLTLWLPSPPGPAWSPARWLHSRGKPLLGHTCSLSPAGPLACLGSSLLSPGWRPEAVLCPDDQSGFIFSLLIKQL